MAIKQKTHLFLKACICSRREEIYVCLCTCLYTHIHIVTTLTPYSPTNWFSLHRIPALQDGKCSGNKASGKPNSCAVWSYSMLHLSFSSDKLYWMINNLFPPFFFWCSSLQWLKRLNKHEKATCDSYTPPQKRGCSKKSNTPYNWLPGSNPMSAWNKRFIHWQSLSQD